MVQGELSATPRFSDQQQKILRALCKPLFADGDGFNPASDLEVSDTTLAKDRGEKPLIVVAAAPKSGSTFLVNTLMQLTGLRGFRL